MMGYNGEPQSGRAKY